MFKVSYFLIASILAQLIIFAYVSLFINFKDQSLFFYGLIILSFIPFLVSYHLLKKVSAKWDRFKIIFLIFLAAIIFSISFFPINTDVDHDLYRYFWDGYLLSLKINPYQAPPLFFSSQIANKFPYLEKLEFKNLTAIYPPLSELIFFIDHTFFGFSIVGAKFLFLLFLLLTIWVLFQINRALVGADYRIWLFAANPLVLYETVGSVHNDIVMILLLSLFLLFFIKQKDIKAGLFLGLSIGSKLVPIFLIPIIILKYPKRYKLILACLLALLVLYLPFIYKSHIVSIFQTLLIYNNQWIYAPGAFALFQFFLNSLGLTNTFFLTKIVFWIGLIGLFVFLIKDRGASFINSMLIIFTYILVANSVLFPWYVIWILWLLPFLKTSYPFIILSITVFLIPIGGYSPQGIPAIREVMIWLPFYLSLGVYFVTNYVKQKSSSYHSSL